MSTVASEDFQSEEYEPGGEPTLEADPVDKAEQQVEVELGEDEL